MVAGLLVVGTFCVCLRRAAHHTNTAWSKGTLLLGSPLPERASRRGKEVTSNQIFKRQSAHSLGRTMS